MKVIYYLLACVVALAVGSSYYLSRPVVTGVSEADAIKSLTVAPRERALTLARHSSGAVLLVTQANAEGVLAIDVNAATGEVFKDTLHAYTELEVQGLQALYDTTPSQLVPWQELGAPFPGHDSQIAAGTNYREHAEEVGHDGDPFLFPKLSQATAWNSEVGTGTRLDYEVELCAVPLKNHSESEPSPLGYLLCGDYTDRWLLVKHMDLGGEMGRTGFPIAKGGSGRLPIGPLLVIPHQETFYRELELSLYANGTLRQKALAGSMIWQPREILAAAIADCRTPYQLRSGTAQIVVCEGIPAGTLVLTGTPGGVLFHLATLWNPWVYLGRGDVVVSFGTYLGYMRNTIVAN
ncbi:MAG: fumarylacetoacetate hydrolase family protein [Halieaceae bacterium]|jgi:2,4-didehydro-3-deoxy-L-rhamnonate hydrolase|nr:fumarylacetoacetate hydrolase family protein [Halieaceae bacterium]